jgi:cytochrome c553
MNTRLRFAVSVASGVIALLAISPPAFAQKVRSTPPQIVTWNCSGCHGVHGNAPSPEFPSLAGLDASYIEQRIAAFRAAPTPPSDELLYWLFNHAESKKIAASSSPEALANMVGIAHALTQQEIKEAAAWYSAQKPKPPAGHSANLAPGCTRSKLPIKQHQAKANGQDILHESAPVTASALGSLNYDPLDQSSWFWPVQNVQLSAGYSEYTKFNEGIHHRDGFGQDASANSLVYVGLWLNFERVGP